MDSDTNDESNNSGGTSVLKVAGLATLQPVPRTCVLGKFSRESQNNPVRKEPYARATVQLCHATREVVGTDFEPFAKLSSSFRDLSPAVVLHHASPCLYFFKHMFFGRSRYLVLIVKEIVAYLVQSKAPISFPEDR